MDNDSGQGPIEKADDVKQKVADKLEPSEEELSESGGPAGASSPFSSGERPGEQQSSG